MVENVFCPICDKENSKKIKRFKFQDLNSNLVLCKGCGLGYLNPRWNKNEYLRYYENSYDAEFRPDLLFGTTKTSRLENNIIVERFKQSDVSFANATTILDIGSGAGDNLLAFRNASEHLDCFAIEPSKASQTILASHNIVLLSDDVDAAWETDCAGKFDIVVMRHVLEHFLDPVAVLKKVNNVLSENGVLYIAVPNNLLENRIEGWLRVAHTYYFNRFTLAQILRKAALKISTLKLEDEFNKFEVFAFVVKDNMMSEENQIKNSFCEQDKSFKKIFKKGDKQGWLMKLLKNILRR